MTHTTRNSSRIDAKPSSSGRRNNRWTTASTSSRNHRSFDDVHPFNHHSVYFASALLRASGESL